MLLRLFVLLLQLAVVVVANNNGMMAKKHPYQSPGSLNKNMRRRRRLNSGTNKRNVRRRRRLDSGATTSCFCSGQDKFACFKEHCLLGIVHNDDDIDNCIYLQYLTYLQEEGPIKCDEKGRFIVTPELEIVKVEAERRGRFLPESDKKVKVKFDPGLNHLCAEELGTYGFNGGIFPDYNCFAATCVCKGGNDGDRDCIEKICEPLKPTCNDDIFLCPDNRHHVGRSSERNCDFLPCEEAIDILEDTCPDVEPRVLSCGDGTYATLSPDTCDIVRCPQDDPLDPAPEAQQCTNSAPFDCPDETECTSWTDGCNTCFACCDCGVDGSDVYVCTKKACPCSEDGSCDDPICLDNPACDYTLASEANETSSKPTTAHSQECEEAVFDIVDKGLPDQYRGWYDPLDCGVCNQYCRWVGESGSGGDPSEILSNKTSYWSCETGTARDQDVYPRYDELGISWSSNTTKCSHKNAAPGTGCADWVFDWHDKDGQDFDCEWYGEAPGRCNTFSEHDNENFGFTANDACCSCVVSNGIEDNSINEVTSGNQGVQSAIRSTRFEPRASTFFTSPSVRRGGNS